MFKTNKDQSHGAKSDKREKKKIVTLDEEK